MNNLNQKLSELITAERFVGRSMLAKVRKLSSQISAMEQARKSTEEIEEFARLHGVSVGIETIKVMMHMCR
jgi:hypothetical protein